jgi:hypothetical protein
MTAENKTWDSLKSDYLHQVEKALSSLKHPQISEVLSDVRSHLDRRFAELQPDEQIRENFRCIIDEMGPPADYADLLAPDEKAEKSSETNFPRKSPLRIFVIILLILLIVPILLFAVMLLAWRSAAYKPSPPVTQNAPMQNPKVIRTTPVSLSNDVSPDLKEITVTFDQLMMNLSWSWVGGDLYPKTTGSPSYDKNRTTCTLPCELEPGKIYWIGVNSPRFKNFQTELGVPAVPYAILFATKNTDGRPTPIPENYIEEAKRVNSQP